MFCGRWFQKGKNLWKILPHRVIAYFNTQCFHKLFIHIKKFKILCFREWQNFVTNNLKTYKPGSLQVLYPYKTF